MKASKKIVGATCALVAAVALSAGSTFAWFASNDTVTATGMSVTAVTNSNLYIKEGIIGDASEITGIVANMSGVAHSLKPADLDNTAGTVTVRVPATYTTDPGVDNAGSAATWTDINTFTASTQRTDVESGGSKAALSQYIAYETMTLVRKAQTPSNADIDATVTITLSATSALNGALRCGFLVGTNWTESPDASVSGNTITWNFDNIISNLADNTCQAVSFAVWYEGEDSNCTSNNAITVSSNTVAISFVSADHS